MQNVPNQTPEVKLYTQQEVDAIVAETIEACAKVCEKHLIRDYNITKTLAAAIRARTLDDLTKEAQLRGEYD